MCGIAGIYLKDPAQGTKDGMENFANSLLLEIEDRGRQATGFVSVGWDGSVKLDKADKPASAFVKEREEFQDDVQCVLLHTRWATQGPADIMGNNHPVSYGSCFAVHNGHISNDDDLFEEEKLSRKFQVDSEIIPAVIDKYGFDTPENIKKALEKLSGGMAIAVIDPVKHPKRLLLARGKSNPLYIFENKNVIVWASTFSAIKDTWAKLLGTPPAASKIKYSGEGKFHLVEDCGPLVEHDFTPKSAWSSYSRNYERGHVHRPSTSGSTNTRSVRRTTFPIKPWDGGPFESEKEFDEAIRAYRREGHGVARIWAKREDYSHKDLQDVKGLYQWLNCVCGHGVIREDLTSHARYGLICKDCYEVIRQKYIENAEAEEEGRTVHPLFADPLEGIEIPDIPDGDRKNLESWAEKEAKFHRYTLCDLSDETGYSVAALDFLLFRTEGRASDFGAGMIRLKLNLLRAYHKLNEELRLDYGDTILDEVRYDSNVTTETAQDVADEYMYPWVAYSETVPGRKTQVKYLCTVHNEFFGIHESCYGCVAADEEKDEEELGETLGGDSSCGVQAFEEDRKTSRALVLIEGGKSRELDYTQCSDCGVFGPSDSPCVECEKKGDLIKVTNCCCKATRDRKCKNKLAFILADTRIGEQKGYCKNHWNKCSASKCGKEANFTGNSGQRYCHSHSRKKNGIADTAAIKDGGTILEVK